MSQSSSAERTEPASDRKRRQARERGEVRKSTELNIAVLIILMFAALNALWSYIGARCSAIFIHFLEMDIPELTQSNLGAILLDVLIQFLYIVVPMLVIALVGGVIINYVQVGFLFTTKPLAPKFSRINPASGIKRMFSMRSIVELLKSLAKVAVIIAVVYTQGLPFITRLPSLIFSNPVEALDLTAEFAFGVGLKIGMAMLVVGAADFGYQWWKHEKDLKMTKQEVKDEYKQTEGNPQTRGRIKQKQRQMSAMRMMQKVPDADVVITNPTHYAVALRYDESVAAAPIVLAKGVDLVAKRIKDIARENHVELVENRPLAQALYAACDVGQTIPEELFQAVAEVLAYVYRLNERTGTQKKGGDSA